MKIPTRHIIPSLLLMFGAVIAPVWSATPYQDKTVNISKNVNSGNKGAGIPIGTLSADQVLASVKVPGWQFWLGDERRKQIIAAVAKAKSVEDVLAIAHSKEVNPKDFDAILLSGVRAARTVKQILQLEAEARSEKTRKSLLIQGMALAGSMEELQGLWSRIEVEGLQHDPDFKACFARHGMRLARTVDDFGRILYVAPNGSLAMAVAQKAMASERSKSELEWLGQQTNDEDAREALRKKAKSAPLTAAQTARQKDLIARMNKARTFEERLAVLLSGENDTLPELVIKAMEKTSNVRDLVLIYNYSGNSEIGEKVIEKALASCRSMEDIVGLHKQLKPNPKWSDKIVLAGLKHARSKDDLSVLADRAGSADVKTKILAHPLANPSGPSAYSWTNLAVTDLQKKYSMQFEGDWQTHEVAWVKEALDSLPPQFVVTTKILKRGGIGPQAWLYGQTYQSTTCRGTSLGSYCNSTDPVITMFDIACRDKQSFKETLVHEMAHAYIYDNGHPNVLSDWKAKFWNGSAPHSPSVSVYGNSNPEEDLAESVRSYWVDPAGMRAKSPDRYQFVKERILFK